jgi:hypothetical protein
MYSCRSAENRHARAVNMKLLILDITGSIVLTRITNHMLFTLDV